MRICLTSVFVEDQSKALKFYTEVLGFRVKHDIPVGEEDRWLTVVSPEDPGGTELLLEPLGIDIARTYQQELFAQGISAAQFDVTDLDAEFARLKALDVEFKLEPTDIGPANMATFNDTCGNFINLMQYK